MIFAPSCTTVPMHSLAMEGQLSSHLIAAYPSETLVKGPDSHLLTSSMSTLSTVMTKVICVEIFVSTVVNTVLYDPPADGSEGSWSAWGGWSPCSQPCNGGERTRSRTCVGGTSCPGSNIDTERCNTNACPSK